MDVRKIKGSNPPITVGERVETAIAGLISIYPHANVIASSVPLWIAKGVVAGWWTVAGDSLSVHWSLQIIK
ncbi:hypothetical protein ACN38_g7124 [Penicillium nordicum]|uniref:Uncharacterized protein n=1 Tax=Penicillium nordicum TaxID=229535 RepID=A0A0M8NYR0_9EURO|nr:hypothetical protein ACN38_g7124 [Penicillium nordicum]